MPGDFTPVEPSVLDWIRSLLRGRPLPIPAAPRGPSAPYLGPPATAPAAAAVPSARVSGRQLRLLAIPIMFLLIQAGLESWEPRSDTPWPWVIGLVVAAEVLLWSLLRGDLPLGEAEAEAGARREAPVRAGYLAAGAILAVLTFLLSTGNTFRALTVVAWIGSIGCVLFGFWEGDWSLPRVWDRLAGWVRTPGLRFSIDGWALALWIALGVAALFRFYWLDRVPLDMWSDHAEKLLDVMDVLKGRYSIFFLRNTGREPLQFYLAAATLRAMGTGLSFLTLKLGTAFLGWLTLPFVYLCAREFGGRRVAVAAVFLAGIAFWPNLLGRTGLRFTLYPFFAAPAIFFLIHGLRQQRRNDFLWAGLFTGLSLYGYSPARVLPFVLIAGVLVYMSHPVARGRRMQVLFWLATAGVIALVVFMPLAQAGLTYPDQFLSRALTRMTAAERPLPGSALLILLTNTWNALKMFNWDSGAIWVVTIPHKPLLDVVSGALFLIGLAIVVARYVRRRSWMDLFLLLSIPLLMVPSILALAFPEENPAPNRAGGALIPVFIIAGMALVAVLGGLRAAWPRRSGVVVATTAAVLMVGLAVTGNVRMLFRDFASLYSQGSWNTKDAGDVIRGFADSIGTTQTAHVVPYPHWFDTRLVGFQAGTPGVDYALPRDAIDGLAGELAAQLFLVNTRDLETMEKLRQVFPDGVAQTFVSGIEGRDFWIYFVPQRGQQP
jgi:hypothetical protein